MPYRLKSHRLKPFKNFACVVSAAALIALAPAVSLAAGSVTFGQPVEPAGLDPTVGSAVASGEVTWQNILRDWLLLIVTAISSRNLPPTGPFPMMV